MRSENRPFGLLAEFYDELLAEVKGMNAHARGVILGDSIDRVESVCDLACGSGTTALEFARAGKRVFAVDNSPVFCKRVRASARREKLPVTVLCADMRSFRLPEPVDFLTCEFSALNNLTRRRDLARVLRAVHRALKPGGRFLFDVNTIASMTEQVVGNHWAESPRFKLIIRGTLLEADGTKGRLDCEWFLPVGKLWRHQRESVINVAWTDRELRAALREAGFARPKFFDGMDVRPPIVGAARGWDAYYLTRRVG